MQVRGMWGGLRSCGLTQVGGVVGFLLHPGYPLRWEVLASELMGVDAAEVEQQCFGPMDLWMAAQACRALDIQADTAAQGPLVQCDGFWFIEAKI